MTYKDNLKTDLIILFKMNMSEAKKLDHILWPYYPYTQSNYVSFIFYLLP